MRFKPQLLTLKDKDNMQQVYINDYAVTVTNSSVCMSFKQEDPDMTIKNYGIYPEGYDLLQKTFKKECYIELSNEQMEDPNPLYQISSNKFINESAAFFYTWLSTNLEEFAREELITIYLNMDLLNTISKATNQKQLKLAIPDLFKLHKQMKENRAEYSGNFNGINYSTKTIVYDDSSNSNHDFIGIYILSFSDTNKQNIDITGKNLFKTWSKEQYIENVEDEDDDLIYDEPIEDDETIEEETRHYSL